MRNSRKSAIACCVVSVLACMSCISCADTRNNAAESVKKELVDRNAKAARSTRLYEKGAEQLEKNHLKEAGDLLEQALREDNRNAGAWIAIGIVRYRQEDWFKAAQSFHRASRLEPNRYEPKYNLGLIFEAVGEYPRAIDRYEAALKLSPNQTEILENLARCYLKTRTQPQRAKELIDRALQVEMRPQWRQWLKKQSQTLNQAKETQREE